MNKAIECVSGFIIFAVISAIVGALNTFLVMLFSKSWSWWVFGVVAVIAFVVLSIFDARIVGDGEVEEEDEPIWATSSN